MAPDVATMAAAAQGIVRESDNLQPGERRDWEYFDRVTIPAVAAGNTFFFFRDGKVGKTDQDTNLETPGMLPAGYTLTVKTIMIRFQFGTGVNPVTPLSIADYIILRRSFIVLKVGSLDVADMLTRDCPGGGGPFGTLSLRALASASIQFIQNGYPTPVMVKKLDPPYTIPSQQNFSVRLEFESAPATSVAIKVRCALAGTLYRAWQ